MSYNNKTGMYEGFIYKIHTSESKNEYVGQTRKKSIYDRWKDHISSANTGAPQVLYKAMRLHGIDTFTIEVIEKLEANTLLKLSNMLNDREIYYIALFDTYYHGYNMTKGGDTRPLFGKPTVAYDSNGNFLYETESGSEMAERADCDLGVVIKCCKGLTVPRNGLIFRYKGDAFDKYRTKITSVGDTHIYCFYDTGEYYKEFDRIIDASVELNIEYGNLIPAITYKRIIAGYYFNTEKVFDYQKKKHNYTPVDVYDQYTKEFIGSFDSIRDAFRFLDMNPETSVSGIINCLNGKASNSYGYIWRYPGETVNDRPFIYAASVMKPINVYDKQNNFVEIYPSQKIAGDIMNVNKDGINSCLKGRQKTAFGYKYFYANDPNQPDKSHITDITAYELITQRDYNLNLNI